MISIPFSRQSVCGYTHRSFLRVMSKSLLTESVCDASDTIVKFPMVTIEKGQGFNDG